ncbi:MAG: hypothetical protein ABEJ87_04325 [Candidatus Nanohalobium sp.]
MKHRLLSYSIASIYILFGALKLLGETTVLPLVQKAVILVPPETFMYFLGTWEVIIGILFLKEEWRKPGLILMLPHMLGTTFPMIADPGMMISERGLSLEAHYILKNIVFVAGAWTVQQPEFREDLKNKLKGLHS